MKYIYLFLIVTFLFSCEYSVSEDYSEIDIKFEYGQDSLLFAWYWVTKNIKYRTDESVHDGKKEEWQTPQQTYYRKTGDCEDFAGLLGYFIKDYYTVSVIVINDANGRHAILKVDNKYVEPMHYGMYYDKEYVLKNKVYELTLNEFIDLCYKKSIM